MLENWRELVWHVLPSLGFAVVSLEHENKPNINVPCFLLVSHSVLYHVFFSCFSINFITWRGTYLNLEIGCLVYSQSSFSARPICLVLNVCFLLSYSIQFNLSTFYKLAQRDSNFDYKINSKIVNLFCFQLFCCCHRKPHAHSSLLLFYFILYYIIAWIIPP